MRTDELENMLWERAKFWEKVRAADNHEREILLKELFNFWPYNKTPKEEQQ